MVQEYSELDDKAPRADGRVNGDQAMPGPVSGSGRLDVSKPIWSFEPDAADGKKKTGKAAKGIKSSKKDKKAKRAKRVKKARKPKSGRRREKALPALFQPMELRDQHIRNRIWMPPMDTYSSLRHDGVPTNFHYQHYVSRALGGFGVVIGEATAVNPQGRISPCDVGLWDDEQTRAWQGIVRDVKAAGAVPIVQLNHSGRKGSSGCSSMGYINATVPVAEGGWQPVGPSPIAFGRMAVPVQLSRAQIASIVADFRSAAVRAVQAGFLGVELHAAHGYLLSQFLDPLINRRNDEYGGDLSGRMRLLIQVTDAVREVIPSGMPLLVRMSATDWATGGWGLDETIRTAKVLKLHGVDLIDVSTGGLVPGVKIPAAPNYQVPFSYQVRSQVLIPTTAVGLITKPRQADRIVRKGLADAVEIGRASLRDPYWPLRAAYKLGLSAQQAPYPEPYRRGAYGVAR